MGPFLKAHAAAERHPPHTQRPSRFPAPLPADVLLSSATVRESLMLAALLKLPRSMRRADKVARVDAVLKELASAWDGGTAHRGLVGVWGGGGWGGLRWPEGQRHACACPCCWSRPAAAAAAHACSGLPPPASLA